jgi:hypothetical protein
MAGEILQYTGYYRYIYALSVRRVMAARVEVPRLFSRAGGFPGVRDGR